MNVETLIESLTPDVYQQLREAIELGKWPDGRSLSSEQKSLCMEAILRYEHIHEVPETERVGYIEQSCQSSRGDSDVQPITIH